jgi:hypothetical protein
MTAGAFLELANECVLYGEELGVDRLDHGGQTFDGEPRVEEVGE